MQAKKGKKVAEVAKEIVAEDSEMAEVAETGPIPIGVLDQHGI
jgi:hypothetical protein